MTTIVLLFYFPKFYTNQSLPVFYGQLSEAFKSKGYNVLAINMKARHDNFILNKIIKKKPALIITFNHIITDEIYKNTNCPVLAIEADTYKYFAKKELIKKYAERFYIGIASKGRFQLWHELLPFLQKNHFIEFKNSTLLRPLKQEQDIEISIIATLVALKDNNGIVKFIQNNWSNPDKMDVLQNILQKAKYNINDVSKSDYIFLKTDYNALFNYLSYQNRAYTLDYIADLGLKVFGNFRNIERIHKSLTNLSVALQAKDVINVQDNEILYNRSKLSLNIHFAHNVANENLSVYSWRVTDIMATNACLVSTFCPAIKNDFKKWVNIPMFENRYEARELCKKLLSEDDWRKEIVEGSQMAIKEGKFSFYDRVQELEEIFSLQPSNQAESNQIEYIDNVKKTLKIAKNIITPVMKYFKKLW